MTVNPPPNDVQNRYFTDDITLLPVTAIWRICRRQGVTGWLMLFLMLVARKFLGMRYPANHATCRVVQLTPISNDDIPECTRAALAAFEAACHGCGMEQISWFRPPWIGNKAGMFSIWLQPSGEVYCNITQVELRHGEFYNSKTIFACHSKLSSGVELHTSTMAPEDWIPELVPPDQDIERLAPGTEPLQVIERHRQRIAGRSDVIRFTSKTLLDEIVVGSQKLVDFLVAKGFYAPLSSIEVQRLKSVNPALLSSGKTSREVDGQLSAE